MGLACICMPRWVLVGLCAGCRPSQGASKRAQAPTRDHSQACFSRVIMLAFISLQILPAAIVRRSLGFVPSTRCRTCLSLAAPLAMLPQLCRHPL